MDDLGSMLHNHGLKNTPFRKELLSLFYNTRSSLTIEEIKRKLETSKDKVTIYRALDAFEQNGLIHRVPDRNNLTRYAACHSTCNEVQHTNNHAHFICIICNETYCIEEVEAPKIDNIGGFTITSSKLTLEGVCSHCQKK